MGSYFGAKLARNGGLRVTLVGTWREALEVINASGVEVEEAGGRFHARLRAVTPDDAPSAQVVLVLVKSHQTALVAEAVARSVTADGVAVTLQNGLGNPETLASAMGGKALVVGTTTSGATLSSPGRVRGYPAPTALARDRHGRVELVRTLLESAGLPTSVQEDFEVVVWRKLAVNCALNPLSALRGVPNGALLDSAETRHLLEDAAREVEAVAVARGVRGSSGFAEAALEAARLTAENRSSMLQDLEKGRQTEIEVLNGALVREGLRLGVPTPVNRELLEALRSREAAIRGASTP